MPGFISQQSKISWHNSSQGADTSKHMRVLELYSGIGGFHYALRRALPRVPKVVDAIDVNQLANRVYQHNFGIRPHCVSLEQVPAAAFDDFRYVVANCIMQRNRFENCACN